MTIMWEYSQIDDGEVEWGISQNLENSTTATFENSQNNNYIFTAVINNLSPNTKYFYRTVNNNIYAQYDLYEVRDEFNEQLYEVRQNRGNNIDFSKSFNNII